MARIHYQNVAFLFVLISASLFSPITAIPCRHTNGQDSDSSSEHLETYIVHVTRSDEGQVNGDNDDQDAWYASFLPAVNPDDLDAKPRMVYTYRHVLTGFAAKLSAEEAETMSKLDGFVFAKPQRVLPLHTTHSPNFLGLHQNLGVWKGSNYGQGIIVGLLDTGITPFHPSFDDAGVPPPPAKWKGTCEFTEVGACNNKLIGARNFISGSTDPPTDDEGHGTHTSSTAAGNFVQGANVFGNANGTACGMAPLAHVAMYKVCGYFCAESDMLAALDAAIDDGVDVLSISIGGPSEPFFESSLAIGTFSAIQKGIFVSLAAGNSGPFNATLSNEAPWMLTVGASTIDRKIKATTTLGNKEVYEGETLFQPKDFPGTLLPLVFPGMNGDEGATVCDEGSLDEIDVKGKVVVCERGGGIDRIAKGQTVKDAGGAAMILMNDEVNGDSTLADAHVLPALHVGSNAGYAILTYLNSTASPVASIQFLGTVIGDDKAPQVTSFSSRGPNLASPGILKPDIIGPGVNILAAWNESVEHKTGTKANFNIISGTSMATPHLAGIATLLKSVHPDWSPAAIKSAIMTTADQLSLNQKPITDERELKADIFAIGAGHINPSKAANPGLVYDIQPDDYIPYLCGLGYTDDQVEVIVGKKVSCSKKSSISEAQLNYPSFAITLGSETQTYKRTVTNVGEANSTYEVEISAPVGSAVSVSPATLEFSATNQNLTYTVSFQRGSGEAKLPYVEGSLKWSSEKYSVRSPISINLV